MHPDADRIIDDYVRRHTKAGMTDEQLAKLAQAAVRAATLGRRFPVYATLEHFDTRVAQRLEVIREETGRQPTQAEVGKIRAEEARRARGAVAGYDLVFTPVKSLVLLWALDERGWVRDAVQTAHERARDAALALLEEHAAFTRSGDVGQAQLATRGLVYAMFDHYDSRDGDPNLHTHVAIVNKIQATDGGWRSLDGRALYRIGVAASEHYNSTLETVARDLLGVDFTVRPDTVGKRHPVREVAGVPLDWIRSFSSRRVQIEARYEDLIVDYRRAHGHDHQAAFRLAEQANLANLGLTTDIETAGSVLGIGRSKAYALAKNGEFPVRIIRIGRSYVVPVPALLELLGVDWAGPEGAAQPGRWRPFTTSSTSSETMPDGLRSGRSAINASTSDPVSRILTCWSRRSDP